MTSYYFVPLINWITLRVRLNMFVFFSGEMFDEKLLLVSLIKITLSTINCEIKILIIWKRMYILAILFSCWVTLTIRSVISWCEISWKYNGITFFLKYQISWDIIACPHTVLNKDFRGICDSLLFYELLPV